MSPKVYNLKRDKDIPPDAVFIGRPSVYGNPFVIGRDGTRDEVIEKCRQYVSDRPWLVEKIRRELKGKDLICFCKPLPCHGDIYLEIANR